MLNIKNRISFNDIFKTIKSIYNFNILIFNQFSFIFDIIKQLQTLSYLNFFELFLQVNPVYFFNFKMINLASLLINSSFFSKKIFCQNTILLMMSKSRFNNDNSWEISSKIFLMNIDSFDRVTILKK